jgi:hypothetical protein
MGGFMQGERHDHWMQLCQQASIEQDPEKLIKLIQQINNLLKEKHMHLSKNEKPDTEPTNLSHAAKT